MSDSDRAVLATFADPRIVLTVGATWRAVVQFQRDRLVHAVPVTRDSARVSLTDAGRAALAEGGNG